MADRGLIRMLAWEALNHHTRGNHAEALERAVELARVNPHYTPALNLVASLHTHAATAAWEERAPGDEEAASASVVRHRRAAVEAYAAAARIAPNCAMTGGMHAEALANDHRFPEAMMELHRVISMTETDHDDPTAHHIVYDLIDSSAKARKRDAVDKARTFMESLAARINNEIVPRQAANLLRADAALGQLQLQERATLISETFPYSSRAQLLRVYIELEQGRAVDAPLRRKAILLRVLALVSDAADSFDSSLLIALYHAKVLFALDRFDELETECRRALSIQDPIDPILDDIPPAISVLGTDCDARVSFLRNQFSDLHTQIVAVAARCWSSILTTQHRERVDRVISVRVDTLQQHYDGIDQAAAKTISTALRFLKTQDSWSFFICPNSSCDGKKFVDPVSLWEHMRRQHRNELWNKLQSILGPVQNERASKDDHSLDGISLSQDSEQHDIFNLPNVQDMLESLLRSPTIGIQVEPLVEMRRRKCRQGAEILEDIKKKLRMLPKDKLSTQFEELCFAIKNMWLKLLKISALDHREVILPLARSYQWIEMKRSIALSAKDLGGIIGGANIDAVFGNAPGAPDHQSGDNLQFMREIPVCRDSTLLHCGDWEPIIELGIGLAWYVHAGRRRAGRRPCVCAWRRPRAAATGRLPVAERRAEAWRGGRRGHDELAAFESGRGPEKAGLHTTDQMVRRSDLLPSRHVQHEEQLESGIGPCVGHQTVNTPEDEKMQPIQTNEVSTQHRVRNVQQHTRGNVENHHYLCKWSLILLELVLRIGYLLGSVRHSDVNSRMDDQSTDERWWDPVVDQDTVHR